MGDDLLNRYEDVQTLRSDWEQVLDRYGVDYIVYNRGEALANVLATSPMWRLVYEDSVAVIYVRVPSPTAYAPTPDPSPKCGGGCLSTASKL